VERAVADWVELPAALYFSSGYAANVGALGCLLSAEDAVFSDALNHASLIDGIRLSPARARTFPHLDLDVLAAGLAAAASAPARWVIVESYYSMDGDGPDLARLRELCDAHDAQLYVDEAHGLGLWGRDGAGRCQEAGVRPDVLLAGFGKAVGSQGACLCGSAALRTWLWNRARSFVFSTAPAPAAAAGLLEQLRRCRGAAAARERVHALSALARERLSEQGLDLGVGGFGPILGVRLGAPEAALAAAERLRALGILAQAIRPPTVPAGASRVRLTLHAGLSREDVERLAAALGAIVTPGAAIPC
jgi:8-amino-7-oxononanoate synthase